MLNQLFTEVSSEQQETVVGGLGASFSQSVTGFFGKNVIVITKNTSTPDGGSTTETSSQDTEITTGAISFIGANLPASFFAAPVA
ncbi:MAG TPA: CTB family bacteriocin [Nodularia sp. (in: cyanobacteria)]|nr:CTB family bacteriocin [Nodularia sp. (in: cyanobacteria)]